MRKELLARSNATRRHPITPPNDRRRRHPAELGQPLIAVGRPDSWVRPWPRRDPAGIERIRSNCITCSPKRWRHSVPPPKLTSAGLAAPASGAGRWLHGRAARKPWPAAMCRWTARSTLLIPAEPVYGASGWPSAASPGAAASSPLNRLGQRGATSAGRPKPSCPPLGVARVLAGGANWRAPRITFSR